MDTGLIFIRRYATFSIHLVMNAHAGDRPTFSIAGVLLLALVFHLVFINSVFDCYFTSHVVHGMQHFRLPTDKTRAKRLVLLVGASAYWQ
jgi:hypothetical protein